MRLHKLADAVERDSQTSNSIHVVQGMSSCPGGGDLCKIQVKRAVAASARGCSRGIFFFFFGWACLSRAFFFFTKREGALRQRKGFDGRKKKRDSASLSLCGDMKRLE